MDIYVASDRHGWVLKNKIVHHLKETNHSYIINDLCTEHDGIADAPSYAFFVAKIVNEKPRKNLGILICKTGNEMVIPANRMKYTRACLCLSKEMAKTARTNIDANIIVIPSDITLLDTEEDIIDSFLTHKYDELNLDNLRVNSLIDIYNGL